MQNLGLKEILQYLIIGLVTIFLIYLAEPEFTKTCLVDLGFANKSLAGLGTLLVILSIGVLFYQLYHPVFYRFFFIKLKDVIKRKNIRSYIMKKHCFKSRWNAEHFYYLIREKCFKENERTVTHFQGAGIHLLYMCSLIFAVGAIGDIKEWRVAFIIASISSYIAGLISDLTLEKQEWALYSQHENGEDFEKLLISYRKACGEIAKDEELGN